jgi:hypothetical protein
MAGHSKPQPMKHQWKGLGSLIQIALALLLIVLGVLSFFVYDTPIPHEFETSTFLFRVLIRFTGLVLIFIGVSIFKNFIPNDKIK